MKRDEHIEQGMGFGITTAVITLLGAIIGLYSATHSFGAVLGGIISIGIADSFSDALGIHVSGENNSRDRHKWTESITALLAKLILSLTFVIIFLTLSLNIAVYTSLVWGFLILIFYNYRLAKRQNQNPLNIISEHILIAVAVIILTYFLGHLVQFL